MGGSCRRVWQLLGVVKEQREQDFVWTVTHTHSHTHSHTRTHTHIHTLSHTHSLITLGDTGKTLDICPGSEIEAEVIWFSSKETATWGLEDGPIRVTGLCSHLFCFPRRETGIPRNPTGFLLFRPIPSPQSVQFPPSHWYHPGLQPRPLTWARWEPLKCLPRSNSPAENQTHLLKTGVWHTSTQPLQWHRNYAAPNPSSESKSLTNLVQTLLPSPGSHDPSISLLKTVWNTLQVQNLPCGFLPPSPLLKGTTWILGDPTQMPPPSRCLP